MNQSIKRQTLKTFFRMLSDLKNAREHEIFAYDFFSDKELDTFTKRLATIYWLRKNRDKANIKRNLQATEPEIALAEELLKKKGIKLALKKIEAEEWANLWVERIKKVTK